MILAHHSDCECAMCLNGTDEQCCGIVMFYVPECCNARVCEKCAKDISLDFDVFPLEDS